jgi:hypothetical protein
VEAAHLIFLCYVLAWIHLLPIAITKEEMAKKEVYDNSASPATNDDEE